MDENNSPVDEVIDQSTQPESDAILDALSDDDGTSTEVVDEENPVEEQSEPEETETQAEVEPTEEEIEEPETAIDPAEEARRRYQERQRVRQEREMSIRTAGEEYTKAAEDEYDARLRSMEVERYNERVSANEERLIGEFERAKSNPDLQIFNPDSPDFNEKAYTKAIKDFDAGYIQRDEMGNIAGLKGSLIEHLQETADLLRGAIKTGQVQQVRANNQLKQSADIKPAATPKEPQKDAILDILKSDD